MISKLIGQQDPGEPFPRAMEVGVGWEGLDLNAPLKLLVINLYCRV